MKISLFMILLLCTASSLAKKEILTEIKITSFIDNVTSDLHQLITNLITNLITGINIGKRNVLDTRMRSVIGNIIKFIEYFIDDFNKIKDNIILPIIGVIMRDLIDKLSKLFEFI